MGKIKFSLSPKIAVEPYSECQCPFTVERRLCCECAICGSPAYVPCEHCYVEWINEKGKKRLGMA